MAKSTFFEGVSIKGHTSVNEPDSDLKHKTDRCVKDQRIEGDSKDILC